MRGTQTSGFTTSCESEPAAQLCCLAKDKENGDHILLYHNYKATITSTDTVLSVATSKLATLIWRECSVVYMLRCFIVGNGKPTENLYDYRHVVTSVGR